MGIVSGVILISSVVAFIHLSQTLLLLLIAAVVSLIGISIILQWPILGLILTILGGFFIKYSGPSNINITVLGIMALVSLWLVKMFVIDRRFRFVASRTFPPILVFIILSLISFGVGMLPLVPYSSPAPLYTQVGGLIIFILSAGAFLFVANTVSLRWLERLTWVFILIGALYMLISLLLSTLSVEVPIIRSLFDSNAANNSMFWTWLAALTFSQAFFNHRLHPVLRAALGILVLSTIYVGFVLANDWKSGWVPPLAAIMAILIAKYWRPAILLAPFGLVVTGILAYLVIGTDTYSWATRVDAWVIVIEIAKVSPFFGLGFANYYWYSLYTPIRGYFVPFNSHSQYVDLIAQTGILGLLSFLWIFFEVGRLGWNLREIAPDGFPRAYTYGVIGGVVGTLVAASMADWVLPFAYNIGLAGFRASILPWVFMGGLVCIEQLTRQKTESHITGTNVKRSYG